MSSAQDVSCRSHDPGLTGRLNENRDIGNIRRQRGRGYMKALRLTLPWSQSADGTHDVELFERAASVFPAADRRNRMAQVWNEHHVARSSICTCADFHQHLGFAHRDLDWYSIAILAQRSGKRLSVRANLIVAPVHDKLRCVDGRAAQLSGVNVLSFN